jgi:hypothetical protein
MPFHVKLSLEGLPHHAWFQEIADKVVGGEALIHHVEQAMHHKEDLWFFVCGPFATTLAEYHKWFTSPCLIDSGTPDWMFHFISLGRAA